MIDLKTLDLEVLGRMDADALESLRDDARALLDRIQEQLEWWNHTPGKPLHRFQFREGGPVFYAEALEDGVLINPALPEGFDCTDNELRSPEERARWWLRPFIETDEWEERERFMRSRHEFMSLKGQADQAPADLEAHIEQERAAWFRAWPEGKRYDVRCLDGGAWDRPSDWGMFATLAEALACVNEKCQ